jgi:hypothetical protein
MQNALYTPTNRGQMNPAQTVHGANYMSKFKNGIEVTKHNGGSIREDQVLVLEELKKIGKGVNAATQVEVVQATRTAKCMVHAISVKSQ